jgi:hypothetical protein
VRLSETITLYCDSASSTAPVGQHPEPDGTWGREKMRVGGPDKGGVAANTISNPDTREFVQKTNPVLLAKKKKKLRATSGGQSEGSSLTARKFYVVDGQGRVLHTFRTREEAEQASAGNRYTKVVTHVEQSTPMSETPEVRDMIRRRPKDTQIRVFRHTIPYPETRLPAGPGSGQNY